MCRWIHFLISILIKIDSSTLNYVLSHNSKNEIIWSSIDLTMQFFSNIVWKTKIGKSIVSNFLYSLQSLSLASSSDKISSPDVSQIIPFVKPPQFCASFQIPRNLTMLCGGHSSFFVNWVSFPDTIFNPIAADTNNLLVDSLRAPTIN